MLTFAVFFPNPYPFQIQVFITTLALAAAGVGAMLPGTLEVRYRGLLRAGGAIGLFAVVFLMRPSITQTVVSYKVPESDWRPVVSQFLSASDRLDIPAIWSLMDPGTRDIVAKDQQTLSLVYDSSRKPLGKVVRRTLRGVSGGVSPTGAAPGVYEYLRYVTKFENDKSCRFENLDLRATNDQRWSVYDYNISPTTIDCP